MRFRLPVKSIAHWLRLQVATVKSLVLTNRSSAPFSVFCFLEEDMSFASRRRRAIGSGASLDFGGENYGTSKEDGEDMVNLHTRKFLINTICLHGACALALEIGHGRQIYSVRPAAAASASEEEAPARAGAGTQSPIFSAQAIFPAHVSAGASSPRIFSAHVCGCGGGA